MKKILLASVVASLTAATAFADNTDTAEMRATGEVIAALSVTAGTDLILPNLVVDLADTETAGDTSVEIICTDAATAPESVSYSGNGNPFAHGSAAAGDAHDDSLNADVAGGTAVTGQCGDLSVAGQANYNYTVSAAVGVPVMGSEVTGVSLGSVTCTSLSGADTFTLNASGADTLFCGGKVTAASDSTTGVGTYAFTSTVTVIYD